MDWLRKNQGQGVRATVDCSLPEAYAVALEQLEEDRFVNVRKIEKKERAIFAPGAINTAVFFYPSDDGKRTGIEVLAYGRDTYQRNVLTIIKHDALRKCARAPQQAVVTSQAVGADEISRNVLAIVESAGLGKSAPGRAPVDERPASGVRSDVDDPTYKAAERPNDFALVVGIDKYSDLPNAEFAERDADAVKAHLMALGLPPRNIIHLSGSKAGRSSIEKYVEQWLPRLAKEDSRIFFYFSGHGAPDVKTGAAYLVPWDGDANFLETTGYPIKRLYEKLSALKAKEIIVAMDTCFSGAGGRSVLPPGSRPLVAKTEQFAATPKIVSLTASAGDQISGTESAQGHGAFTYYLLRGLNGAAKDQTLQGLYDYLKPHVQDTASRLNRDQTPQILGEQTSLRLR